MTKTQIRRAKDEQAILDYLQSTPDIPEWQYPCEDGEYGSPSWKEKTEANKFRTAMIDLRSTQGIAKAVDLTDARVRNIINKMMKEDNPRIAFLGAFTSKDAKSYKIA